MSKSMLLLTTSAASPEVPNAKLLLRWRFSKSPTLGPQHCCPVLRLVLDMRSDECSASIEGRTVDTTIPVSNVYNIYDKMVRMMEKELLKKIPHWQQAANAFERRHQKNIIKSFFVLNLHFKHFVWKEALIIFFWRRLSNAFEACWQWGIFFNNSFDHSDHFVIDVINIWHWNCCINLTSFDWNATFIRTHV